ncbi:M24 family metallopeptidase [Parashewanella curva]|uniref:Xaa-Pro aminopeptidase n=1 Tax=Parashewanella curva TaxID=2338552 RepID=A0A3L8PV61_9GAMM|nr:aminopeptidase P N-terminal domain-containing protein [Parashewanella curva]RLV58463.1 M24 family metallopeptidase [Parashewanella curva]
MDTIYKYRRDRLLKELPANSLVILVGYQQKVRSKNIKYHFRQENDFFYLTGFSEPNAYALIKKVDNDSVYSLFCQAKDAELETSFGSRAGIDGALTDFCADRAFNIDQFEEQLLKALDKVENVFISDESFIIFHQVIKWVNQQRHSAKFDVIKQYRSVQPLAKHLHQHRLIKSPLEIDCIKKAISASIDGHCAVMQCCPFVENESQLAALFMQAIAKHGCTEVAYPSIVASGDNAMCLHYEENNSILDENRMLLIDAGAEYQMYASDITRSYPISGTFTKAQKQIYELVLLALDSAIEKVTPGLVWNELYETCMTVLAKGLIELGLLKGEFNDVMKTEAYKRFTVHKTGHWLGMDVHDVGSYHDSDGNWITLAPNMVFTIEPGIYIPSNATDVPAEYRGIAIRIEDDILVTESGYENLSSAIPRTIEDIEAMMKSGSHISHLPVV